MIANSMLELDVREETAQRSTANNYRPLPSNPMSYTASSAASPSTSPKTPTSTRPPMQLWSDEQKRGNAQKLIAYLLSKCLSGQWIRDRVVDLAFIELAYSVTAPDFQRRSVQAVLLRMWQKGKRTTTDFEYEYADLLVKQQKLEPLSPEAVFFIPVEIAFRPDIESWPAFDVLGLRFHFRSKAEVEDEIDISFDRSAIDLLRGNQPRQDRMLPETMVTVAAPFADWQEVVAPAFDTLRGLFAFAGTLWNWRLSSANPRATSTYPVRVAISQPDDQPNWQELAINAQALHVGRPVISKSDLSKISRLMRIFAEKQPEHSTIQLLAECMRLYAQAMDVPRGPGQLLALWQLAETITLAHTFGSDPRKVVQHLAWFCAETSFVASGYTETLRSLARKRHDVIHRGLQYNVADEDIQVLKTACDVALCYLLREHAQLPTKAHVRFLYQMRDLPHLDVMEDTLHFIRRKKPAQPEE